MMKTKHLSWAMAALMAAIFCIGLASCSSSNNDEDNGSSANPLVGTWYAETVEKGKNYYVEITYNADFTCTYKEFESDRKTVTDSDKGTYKIEGSTLSIWWESEKDYWTKDGPWTTTFTINGNKMTTTESGGTIWTKK